MRIPTVSFSSEVAQRALLGRTLADGERLPIPAGELWMVGADVDHTLMRWTALDFLFHQMMRRPLRTLYWGVTSGPEVIPQMVMQRRSHRRGEVDVAQLLAWGNPHMRDFFGTADLRAEAAGWYATRAERLYFQGVQGALRLYQRAGYTPFLASSSPSTLIGLVAQGNGIEHVVASPLKLGPNGEFEGLDKWVYKKLKADEAGRLWRGIEEKTGCRINPANSVWMADGQSDLPTREELNIRRLVAVGHDLDRYLGPPHLRLVPRLGGIEVTTFEDGPHKIRIRSEEIDRLPIMRKTAGLLLLPLQWLLGDLVSEGEFSPARIADQAGSTLLFAGASSLTELVARGFSNIRQILPAAYFGMESRGGKWGGLCHGLGSLAGTFSLELYHKSETTPWWQSALTAVGTASVQVASFWLTRGVILGGMTMLRVNLWHWGRLGASQFLQRSAPLVDLLVRPSLEMYLAKQLTGWDYRGNATSSLLPKLGGFS